MRELLCPAGTLAPFSQRWSSHPQTAKWRQEHSVWQGLSLLNAAVKGTPVTYSRKKPKQASPQGLADL